MTRYINNSKRFSSQDIRAIKDSITILQGEDDVQQVVDTDLTISVSAVETAITDMGTEVSTETLKTNNIAAQAIGANSEIKITSPVLLQHNNGFRLLPTVDSSGGVAPTITVVGAQNNLARKLFLKADPNTYGMSLARKELKVKGNILPHETNKWSLGSEALKWKAVHFEEVIADEFAAAPGSIYLGDWQKIETDNTRNRIRTRRQVIPKAMIDAGVVVGDFVGPITVANATLKQLKTIAYANSSMGNHVADEESEPTLKEIFPAANIALDFFDETTYDKITIKPIDPGEDSGLVIEHDSGHPLINLNGTGGNGNGMIQFQKAGVAKANIYASDATDKLVIDGNDTNGVSIANGGVDNINCTGTVTTVTGTLKYSGGVDIQTQIDTTSKRDTDEIYVGSKNIKVNKPNALRVQNASASDLLQCSTNDMNVKTNGGAVTMSATGINLGSGKVLTYNGGTDIQVQITALQGTYTDSAVDTAITTAVNNLIDSAPGTLNTLNELASAVNDDASYAATTTTALNARYTKTQADVITDAIQADVNANEADGDTDRALIRTQYAAADTAIIATATTLRNEYDAEKTATAAARGVVQADVDANEATALSARNAIQADVNTNESDGDTDRALIRTQYASADTSIIATATTLRNEYDAEKTATASARTAIQNDVNQNESDGDTDRALIRTQYAAADTSIIATATTLRNEYDAEKTATAAARTTIQNDIDQNESDADTAIALRALAADARFTGNTGIGTTSPFGDSVCTIHGEGKYGSNGVLAIQDSRSVAAGVGGGIQFMGHRDVANNQTVFGSIRLKKDNSTGGQFGAHLELSTRTNGSGDVDVGFTVNSDQTCSTADDLDVGGILKVDGSQIAMSNLSDGGDYSTTSAINTSLNGKQVAITTSARLNASLIGANGNVSNAEYGYLAGVTSDIQTQIDGAGGGGSVRNDFEHMTSWVQLADDVKTVLWGRHQNGTTGGGNARYQLPTFSSFSEDSYTFYIHSVQPIGGTGTIMLKAMGSHSINASADDHDDHSIASGQLSLANSGRNTYAISYRHSTTSWYVHQY